MLQRPSSKPPAWKACRVLVVDSAADYDYPFVDALSSVGHIARPAHGTQDALNKVRTWMPDIVVADLAASELDGYALAVHTRRIPGCERMPLLALSARGKDVARRDASKLGFSAHLIKPIELQSLVSAIELLCGERA